MNLNQLLARRSSSSVTPVGDGTGVHVLCVTEQRAPLAAPQ
jgi:hypothetical protein